MKSSIVLSAFLQSALADTGSASASVDKKPLTEIKWYDPNEIGWGGFSKCHKVSKVFWNYFCVSEKAWKLTGIEGMKDLVPSSDPNFTGPQRVDHIARIMAGWIDNNGDGIPDCGMVAA